MFEPSEAADGSNVPAVTPEPLYVPPEGVAPVSANGASVEQTVRFAGQVTAGGAFTVIVNVHVTVQPPLV